MVDQEADCHQKVVVYRLRRSVQGARGKPFYLIVLQKYRSSLRECSKEVKRASWRKFVRETQKPGATSTGNKTNLGSKECSTLLDKAIGSQISSRK